MRVCKNHITHALKLLNAPHVVKVSIEITCSFCEEKAGVKMFYDHKPIKKRAQYTLRETRNKKVMTETSMKVNKMR
jgi:hypothetical protein